MSATIHSFTNLRKEVVPLLPSHYKKVLEIGCGEGRFSLNLDKDCEYWGVEPNRQAASVASERHQHVLQGTFEDAYPKLPDDYFDLVICNDVIEHMADHAEFLEKIKVKLVPGAYIIGSVPNVRYLGNIYEMLIKKEWEYKSEGILDRTHLRFFTFSSLRRSFIECGYSIEDIVGLNSVISRSRKIKKIIDNIVMYGIILITIGRHSDIQYMQIGFRVRTAL